MKYGFFNDEAKEYCITRPDTPYPWINYLGTQNFFSLFSNTAGGYCFYKDPRLMRLLRYRYNNSPCDSGGRYFYIKDGADVWCPSWMPIKAELSEYLCRHGLGYSIISGKRNDVLAVHTAYVPISLNCEVHRLVLTNTGDVPKDITLTSFVEFCLYNAYDDMTNFQRNYSIGEVEIEGSAIYHKTEYRERRNHYTVFAANTAIDGFDTDRESFLGLYNGFDHPKAVFDDSCGNSVASGWAPIGSHKIKLHLEPGESKSYIFVLGYIENPDDNKFVDGLINKAPAHELLSNFKTDAQFDEGLQALKDYWEDLLSNYHVDCTEDKMSRMVNIWNQYQCMVTFNMSRSASYFESGIGRGMGFRDSNQDLLGFVHLIPDRARERILDIAATQFADGSAYHQYQPLTKTGNSDIGSGFNDDPLWLICGVAAYIKETGDYSILDEEVPFNSGREGSGSLMEHLKRSFHHVTDNLGPHRLPLIGRADWNDCLNLNCFSKTPGESFQTAANFESGIAESVFIAGLFIFSGKDYIALCEYKNDAEEAAFAKTALEDMHAAVDNHGWDGEWFLRAYDAYGEKIGSSSCEEGRIFIEPQGFLVMAEVGVNDGRAQKAVDSVAKHLETDYGNMILQPAYSKYYLNLGEVSSYPPGYKENAGIFCHNNPWVSIAHTVLGNGDKAFELYRKICPSYLEDNGHQYRMEPYVYAQMIAGRDAVRHGEAKNSWLTGTAAWTFVNISQYILGVRPDYNGLIVDPCVPKWLTSYKVTRKWRGATYDIQVNNPHGKQKGVTSIVVDGVTVDGGLIPIFSDGQTHNVTVTLG